MLSILSPVVSGGGRSTFWRSQSAVLPEASLVSSVIPLWLKERSVTELPSAKGGMILSTGAFDVPCGSLRLQKTTSPLLVPDARRPPSSRKATLSAELPSGSGLSTGSPDAVTQRLT